MRKTGVPDQSTTGRGYGSTHQNARTDALKRLRQDDGQPCTRCARPVWWAQRRLLDLDHDDDRTGYRGLAHRSCNRRAGQARSAQARRTRTQPAIERTSSTRSRNW